MTHRSYPPTETIPPEHETELQIVPVSETEKGEETEKERHVIYEILREPKVNLPWVKKEEKKREGVQPN